MVEVFLQYNFSTNPHNSFENVRENIELNAQHWISSVLLSSQKPPFFNDLRPFRTQEESRYQVELTDGSEAGKIKAGYHGFHKK